MTRVADTSLLYAAFDEADRRHTEARDALARPHALDVPLCVLAEFLDLVAYRHGAAVARQVSRDLAALPTFRLTAIGDEDQVTAIWQRHASLSMADAAGVQACVESGAQLLSYDADQHAVLQALRDAASPRKARSKT